MSPTTIILQLAAVHSLILALALLFRRNAGNQSANRILAAWLVLLAVDLSSTILYTEGLVLMFPHLIGIRYGLPILHGPMLYFYVRALAGGGGLRPIDVIHTLPFIGLKIYQSPFFLRSADHKAALFANYLRGEAPVFAILDFTIIAAGLAYTIAAIAIPLRERRRRREAYYSRRDVWPGVALAINAAIWTAALLLRSGALIVGRPLFDQSLYVLVAFWVFAVGYRGAFAARDDAPELKATTASAPDDVPDPTADRDLAERLEAYMREGSWRQDDLTIQDLSNALGVPIHRLSRFINRRYGKNFFAFVNGYRIEEARRLLADTAFAEYSILRIAFEAGFQSKSSFHSVFKEISGITPAEYRKRSLKRVRTSEARTTTPVDRL